MAVIEAEVLPPEQPPKRLNSREKRLVDNLEDVERFPTIVSAALSAGYSEQTARKWIAVKLGDARFATAREQYLAKQSDKARSLRELSEQALRDALAPTEEGGLNPRDRALLAGQVITKVAELDSAEGTISPTDVDAYKRRQRLRLARGIRLWVHLFGDARPAR